MCANQNGVEAEMGKGVPYHCISLDWHHYKPKMRTGLGGGAETT